MKREKLTKTDKLICALIIALVAFIAIESFKGSINWKNKPEEISPIERSIK